MRYLTLGEALVIYHRVMKQSGGIIGVRDLGALESAVALPRMTLEGDELYPTILEKAAGLGFSIIQNHPFIDGNKRADHAAMETFLVINGYEIVAEVDEQARVVISVAAGQTDRLAFTTWLKAHVVRKG